MWFFVMLLYVYVNLYIVTATLGGCLFDSVIDMCGWKGGLGISKVLLGETQDPVLFLIQVTQ